MKKGLRKGLVVKNTNHYGNGVYTITDIKQGEKIHVLSGKKLTLTDVVDSVLAGKEAMNDPLQVGKRTYIDLDEFSRTFNHSCDPTAGVRLRSELFALRDIKAGEQITYDYSSTISPTDWSMNCKCGSKKCRHVIHDVRSISKSQMEFYKNHGALQRYMKPIVLQLEKGTYTIPTYELKALERLGDMRSE